MRRPAVSLWLAALACVILATPPALGEVPAAAEISDDVKARARAEFQRGAELVKSTEWAEALSAFERSAGLRPHPITTYNIGACHRSLGHYTLARATLARALAEDQEAGGGQLPATLTTEIRGLLDELDRLFARVPLRLTPEDTAIAVDGRPLAPQRTSDGSLELLAGIRSPGLGEPAPGPSFTLIVNPGTHVLTLSRKGFADTVVNRTFTPGAQAAIALAIDRLPSLIHISANQEGAVVSVDGVDVGAAPIDLSRLPGQHRAVVRRQGFVPYEAQFDLAPGQELNLRAELAQEKVSLVKRWWFWTAIGAAATVIGVLTYVLTRPPPPLDGGGLGWTIEAE